MNASICPRTVFNTLEATTSSLALSAYVGQSHDQVMQGIKTMLAEMHEDIQKYTASYRDSEDQMHPMFNLPKNLAMNYLAGFSVPLRYAMIKRLSEAQERAAASANYPQALRDYADRLDQEKKNAAQLQLIRVG